ncbi:MAG: exodeoxyribonuclease VII large subunit [Candidatus Limnocylindrales bacterium]
MGERPVICRPSGVVSLLQRVVDGVAGTELGAAPMYVHGIGRNPKMWDNRCYFDLEDPDVPTVRLRAWMEGKKTPEWNHLIVVSALVRFKVKKPGTSVEPELEVLGIQETMVSTTSRDELRTRFAGALQRPKSGVVEIFLKEKPRVVLLTNQGGEADRDIRTQLAGYEDLLTLTVVPVKMTSPESVAQAFRAQQANVGQVDCVVLARGGGEGIQALEHETVLAALSERVIPVMTAIGHASDSTLADELADLTFSVPGALGRWVRDQLEAKARRAAEQKRLSLVDLDKEYRTVLGKLEILEKDRLERMAKLAQLEQERAKDRIALAESAALLRGSREAYAHILSDQRRWKWVAVAALGMMVGWVLGRAMGWW